MSYEIQTFPNGQVSLKDSRVGETMHSSIGPWEEAKALYIEQAQLKARIERVSELPLVIYDVGLGIAANAIATLEVFRESSVGRNVHLLSFENDLSGLRYALQNISHFPFLGRNEDWINKLLTQGRIRIQSQTGHSFYWEVCEGDFFEVVRDKLCPDLIYYDFYSPKTSQPVWGFKSFSYLYELTASHRKAGLETTLITYSSSTAVRSAMILAGFFVGEGKPTAQKRETTVASTSKNALELPLGPSWLEKLKRSSKPLPEDWPKEQRDMGIQEITKRWGPPFSILIVALSFLLALAPGSLQAKDLLQILEEGPRIESEARYGYGFNDLYKCEGHLTQTQTEMKHPHFKDAPLTDSERFFLATHTPEGDLFSSCYDSHCKDWEGFCDQAASASLDPEIHRLVLNTQGLICGKTSETAVILTQETLRELFGYFNKYERDNQIVFFGARANQWLNKRHKTRSPLLGETGFTADLLAPAVFHKTAFDRLRSGNGFIINVGAPGKVLNRVVKKIISFQTLIQDSNWLDYFQVPAHFGFDKEIVYRITTYVYYFDEAKFHEMKSSTSVWKLDYMIFVDRSNHEEVGGFWIEAQDSNSALPSHPDFIWFPREKVHEIESLNTAVASPKDEPYQVHRDHLLELFDRCVPLEKANQWVGEALFVAERLAGQPLMRDKPGLRVQLKTLYKLVQPLPIQDETRKQLEAALRM